tara:strand:+ start:5781 stop:7547 length:1767 start_codon:yes stop_codon:yes gene_type:complete
MVIDDRVLWECTSDLNNDNQITSSDAILLKALLLFTESNTQKTFSNYYSDLVNDGIVPLIDISSLNADIFNRVPSCFDFNISGNEEECDTEILDAFNAYLKSENKTDLNLNDANKFILFLRSLKTQGILNCEVGANPTFMLPTNPNQDKIYFTSGTWIPKVAPGDVGYDESNSTKGSSIDSSGEKFLVSDPTVQVYYDWDGDSSPRSWKAIGLCKVFKRSSNNLSDEYGLIHPPVDIIKNKTLPASDLIPMGTPNIFNGKTIAIDGDYVAVSWHYSSSGVVYIYKDDGSGNYTNIHEVLIQLGSYSTGLPTIELKGKELFVTNPQFVAESPIMVCNFEEVTDYTIPFTHTTAVDILYAPTGPTTQVGFGSCVIVNEEQTKMFVGHPKQERELSWQIDQYKIEETDIFAGAVFTFTKTSNTWSFSKIIYPDLSDYASRSLASQLDIQFGYSIDYKNNNLFISSPRSFATSVDRREGSVHGYIYESADYTLYATINYSDARFDTTSIATGIWNFGTSIVSNSTATNIFVLHNIPSRGTFVSYYSKSSSEFILETNFFYEISDQILEGTLAISDSNATKVFATDNIVKVLV